MTLAVPRGILIWLLLGACGREDRRAGGSGGDTTLADPPAATGAPAAAAAGEHAALRDPVAMKVTAEVDGKRATYDEHGECTYTRDATIYDVPAAMWSARIGAESGELRYLNLTLWQSQGAADLQVSLGLTLGDRSLDIATVKGAPLKGSGTGRAEPKGAGGLLQVEGTGAEGGAIRVRVECERWTEPVAEGG